MRGYPVQLRKAKETEKAALGKLHQVGAAYFNRQPDYTAWITELETLSAALEARETKAFCKRVLESHHSTDERLSILEDFYSEVFAKIAPIDSIMDLACGFNPLAMPWMPITNQTRYYGCDIFTDMVDFLNAFRKHFNIQGKFESCNLIEMRFSQKAQVALILKTLPCLEHIERGFVLRLLRAIPAKYLVISYPLGSLSGKGKGMRETYRTQFDALMAKTGWDFEAFMFSNEMAFLVQKD